MSPVVAAVLALVPPLRRLRPVQGNATPIRPDRLSAHLLRDIGLSDGRDRGGECRR